jgi:alpha-L-fucosidase
MRTKLFLLTLLVISGSALLLAQSAHPDPLVRKKLEWFQDQKFGLLMHWGPYSQWGVVESWSICPEDEDWCKRRGGFGGNYF